MKANLKQYLDFPLEEPIDERRYERHATFVSTDLLTERLSPQGYRPEILSARLDLAQRHSCQPLQSLCSTRIRQGTTPVYGQNGPAVLMPQHVRPLLVADTVDSHVSAEFAAKNVKAAVGPETVLINRSGAITLGRTAVYLGVGDVFLSEHIFACHPKSSLDSGFLAAYLNSWWGKRSLEAGIAGSTGQLQLAQSHIVTLPIPDVDFGIQEAIGNKVRKAGRLRLMIRLRRSQIADAVASLLPSEETVPSLIAGRSAWIPTGILGSRLDGTFNHPMAVQVRARIARSERVCTLAEVSKKIVCGPFGSTLTASEQDPLGEIVLVQPTDISGYSFAVEPGWRISANTLNSKELQLYPAGTVLFARVGIYPHCGVLPTRIQRATISSSMIAAVVDETKVDPYFVSAFFSSPVGQRILYSLQKGTAQPTIPTSELGDTVFPVPDLEVQQSIGDVVKQCDADEVEVARLTTMVKEDVEGIISGTANGNRLMQDNEVVAAWLASNSMPEQAKSE